MKNLNKFVFTALVLTALFGFGSRALAVTAVGLGTTDGFAVLAGQHITDVPSSVITGNVGLSPAAGTFITGLTTAELSVGSFIYTVDGTGPTGNVNNPSLLTTAKNDLTTAYTDAAGKTPVTNTFVAADNQLGGQTLTPGVYAFGHASTANITAASPLTLDGQGNAAAVFVFQASSDLVTASGSTVRLINGAEACNVFWQVSSSATFGTGSTFVGNVFALTSITDNGSSTFYGRLLARNADVILNKTTITKQTCSAAAIAAAAATSTTTTTTPKLPNTGLAPNTAKTPQLNLLIPAIGIISLVSLFVIRKNQRV